MEDHFDDETRGQLLAWSYGLAVMKEWAGSSSKGGRHAFEIQTFFFETAGLSKAAFVRCFVLAGDFGLSATGVLGACDAQLLFTVALDDERIMILPLQGSSRGFCWFPRAHRFSRSSSTIWIIPGPAMICAVLL